MKYELSNLIDKAFRSAAERAGWPTTEPPMFVVEIPKDRTHGDFASNIALLSAKSVRKAPRQIAETLVDTIHQMLPPWLGGVSLAGPGFLNFHVTPEGWFAQVDRAVELGERFGRLHGQKPTKVLLEFVSANPTGPLHVGHARGCALGDALARLLKAAGHDVVKEYYVNDAGLQMEILGRSLLIRYRQYFGGDQAFPDDHYKGDYMKDLAADVAAEQGKKFLDKDDKAILPEFSRMAAEAILEEIIRDMRDFGLEFDNYFSERSLFGSGMVEAAFAELQKRGFLLEKDGARWFASTRFGDEKDRVIVRENGAPTYFASDIAYHHDKYVRGFGLLVDIWGADHHGYVSRLKGAVEALGHDPASLHVQLVQFVRLVRGGEPVAMSTRAGQFDTLRQLIDEVGTDAARFLFLQRSPDSAMDFDLDLAKSQTMENPVYYVQYAHARISSFFEKAREAGIAVDLTAPLDARRLPSEEELGLAREICRFPDVIESCARNLQVHPLPHYLLDLARTFHGYYTAKGDDGRAKFKVVDPAAPVQSAARLKLAHAVAQTLRNGLQCLGVSAPEKMTRLESEDAQ